MEVLKKIVVEKNGLWVGNAIILKKGGKHGTKNRSF